MKTVFRVGVSTLALLVLWTVVVFFGTADAKHCLHAVRSLVSLRGACARDASVHSCPAGATATG